MKTIVVHGDHVTKSYTRLTKFLDSARARNWEIIEDKIETTPSLFGKDRLFLFRGYQKLSKSDLKTLLKFPGTMVIYHEAVIPQTFLKSLPKDTKVEVFELPKLIWNFLDDPSVKKLHKLTENEPVEFIFALLAKRFRDLYWVQTNSKTYTGQPWQVSRLKSQAKKFEKATLQNIINKMAEIDILVKTSKADLISELDLLLTKSLE